MTQTRAARHDTVAVPEPTEWDATRAMKDALRAIARDIPCPKKYASWAPLAIVEALGRAYLRNGNEWVATTYDAELLKLYGLVEAGKGRCGLTAFAIQVRKALMREAL